MKTIRIIHKWIGVICGLFLLLLCLTGIFVVAMKIAGAHTPLFGTIMRVHRTLLLGQTGHFIVALATLLAIVEAVSGYCLSISEARKVGLRKSLAWNFPSKRWGLHNLAGVCCGIPLLIMAVTGLIIFDPDGAGHVAPVIRRLHTGAWAGAFSLWLWLVVTILAATLPFTGILIFLKSKRPIWKLLFWLAPVLLLGIYALAICDQTVAFAARGRLYDRVDSIPHRKVGLILGTSPYSVRLGVRNRYFDSRIKAGADLYHAGKVDWLIVSGGDYRNSENGFDEPVAMRDSLIKQGVDSVHIVLDYDGTRTLNSIAKVRDVYSQDSIVIISQKYHNERALYQAKHLGIDAIAFNTVSPNRNRVWLYNRGREVLARVKLLLDIANGVHPDIKEPAIRDFTKERTDLIDVSHRQTKQGDLLRLRPNMNRLRMNLICGKIPSTENDSIILAFAGAFTGKGIYTIHANVAGDHVAQGTRHKGYTCERNTGAFTWSPASGPQFFYKDYSAALDSAAHQGGMGFAQEMMIHNARAVPTTRPADNVNVFRALCLDSDGQLALYESQGKISFGNFIAALLSLGVAEALYTDMGQGWNYCFYRTNGQDSLQYLHTSSLPYASNFITLTLK